MKHDWDPSKLWNWTSCVSEESSKPDANRAAVIVLAKLPSLNSFWAKLNAS